MLNGARYSWEPGRLFRFTRGSGLLHSADHDAKGRVPCFLAVGVELKQAQERVECLTLRHSHVRANSISEQRREKEHIAHMGGGGLRGRQDCTGKQQLVEEPVCSEGAGRQWGTGRRCKNELVAIAGGGVEVE